MKKIESLIVFIFVMLVSLFCLTFSASAEDIEWVKRSPEDTIEYKFDMEAGTVVLRGEGIISWDYFGDYYPTEEDEGYDFDDYDEKFDYEICHKNHKIKTIIIEEGITAIGHYAFSGLDNLETVILPEGIKEISYGAFNRCEKLKNVFLPQSLEVIDDYAFCKCTKLKHIELPLNLKKIENCAFKRSGLENVYVPESVESFRYEVFYGCDSLKKITFTNATCTMYNCSALKEIVYPTDFTKLVTVANNCKNLKKVIFPSLEKVNNVKIAKNSYSIIAPGCPDVNIGYVNLDMVKDSNVNYAVVTPLEEKIGKVPSFRYIQKGPTGKLSWSEVEGAGYYQLYYKNGDKWEKIYSGVDTSIDCYKSGQYRVRAVSYDGKTHIYGKYANAEANCLWYIRGLSLKDGTLKWKKQDNVTGYIVYYCTEKDGKYKKFATTSENKIDVSSLKNVYSFRIRSYYKSSGGTIYSQYSYEKAK